MVTRICVLFFLVLSARLGAQDRCPALVPPAAVPSPMDTVGDFTIITTDGDTLSLYQALTEDKTVFLDLFYTRCVFCQQYAPVIEEIYHDNGAGEGSVLFWGLSNDPYDSNQVIDAYKLEFDITIPCAGPEGGGIQALTTVIEGQNFFGYPTYCVVCPDRTMFFDPCYPPTFNCFDPFFNYCAALVGINDGTGPAGGRLGSLSGLIHVYPNPAYDAISLSCSIKGTGPYTVELISSSGMAVFSKTLKIQVESHIFNVSFPNLPSGLYILRLLQGNTQLGVEKISILN